MDNTLILLNTFRQKSYANVFPRFNCLLHQQFTATDIYYTTIFIFPSVPKFQQMISCQMKTHVKTW